MSTYNIKLEDKAAFINRLDKLGVGVDSYEVKDDKLKGTFEFTVDDPVVDKIVKTILKQSPKINNVKEMKTKMTKSQLAEIIREELASMKKGKKTEKLDELTLSGVDIDIPTFLTQAAYGLAAFAGVAGVASAAVKLGIKDLANKIKAKNPEITDAQAEMAAAGQFKTAFEKTTGAGR